MAAAVGMGVGGLGAVAEGGIFLGMGRLAFDALPLVLPEKNDVLEKRASKNFHGQYPRIFRDDFKD